MPQITLRNIEGNGQIYMDIMRAICGVTYGKSMIDLMCHKAPYTSQLGFALRKYVDIQGRALDLHADQKYFEQADVLDFLITDNGEYDVAICSDGIEHLTDKQAIGLLTGMDLCSDKQILFTPLGDCDIMDDTHPDSHKSGWTPEKIDALQPNHWAHIVFPDFHPTLGMGAFFFWHCKEIKADFLRVYNELKKLSWTKLNQLSVQ